LDGVRKLQTSFIEGSMKKYKIRFLSENHGEENVTAEFEVTVHQYMKFLGQVKKLKGMR